MNKIKELIKPDLYIDMDETIYNLCKIVIEAHYNKDYNENFNYKDISSYGWGGTKASTEYFHEVMTRKGVFLDGNPIGNSVEIINKLHDEGYNIYFITMPMYYKGEISAICVSEKAQWLKNNFEWINPKEHIIFTGNKKLLDGENRILFDDNLEYLNSWSKGEVICYDQIWNKEWDGIWVPSHDNFYEWVHRITLRMN